MCEKEYEIRQEIKELENRKSELVRKKISYINSRNAIKNLYDATGNIYLMDNIQKYVYAGMCIDGQIQKLNDSLLDKYKELNRIMECNNEKKRRDGFINGIKF